MENNIQPQYEQVIQKDVDTHPRVEPTFEPAPRVEERHPTPVQGPDRMIVMLPQKQIVQSDPTPIPAATAISRPESIADQIKARREASIAQSPESIAKQVAHH